MPDLANDPEFRLTLRQADQAREDFAAILDELDFVKGQLARLPTRAYVSRLALMAAGSVWALLRSGRIDGDAVRAVAGVHPSAHILPTAPASVSHRSPRLPTM
jgi:hypothetical protein